AVERFGTCGHPKLHRCFDDADGTDVLGSAQSSYGSDTRFDGAQPRIVRPEPSIRPSSDRACPQLVEGNAGATREQSTSRAIHHSYFGERRNRFTHSASVDQLAPPFPTLATRNLYQRRSQPGHASDLVISDFPVDSFCIRGLRLRVPSNV